MPVTWHRPPNRLPRMPLLRFRTLAPLLALGLAACPVETTGPDPELRLGTYALHSINGREVPTPAPCGVFRVVEGEVRLEPGSRAAHRLRYAPLGSGRDVTYEGTGEFEERGDSAVVLTLRGRWSHTPETFTSKVHLRRTPQGLARFVGMECDAMDTELYRMQ